MRTAQAVRHGPPHWIHGRRGVRHGGRARRAIAPEALTLFSDRLDDARDYESTVRDFVLLHDLAHSADDFDS